MSWFIKTFKIYKDNKRKIYDQLGESGLKQNMNRSNSTGFEESSFSFNNKFNRQKFTNPFEIFEKMFGTKNIFDLFDGKIIT